MSGPYQDYCNANYGPEDIDDTCPNCGGEGVVYCCQDEIGCVDPESGCNLCERRCDWCRPRPPRSSRPTIEG
jgi:hypothetical protein